MTLDDFKIGYVMAVKYEKFNLFSEAIYRRQKFQGFSEEESHYTHVAILSGGQYAINIMPPKAKFLGARKIPGVQEYYKGKYVKILKFSGSEFENKTRYKIACFYNAIASNLRYDYLGVLSFVIPGIGQIQGRPFCSEAVTESYQHFYPYIFNGVPPHKIYPAHFVWAGDFKIFKEGRIE